MSKRDNNEMWDSISQGLTPTNGGPKEIPILEILRTIRFCLQDNIEDFETAIKLTDILSKIRKDVVFLNWKAMVEFDAKKYVRSFLTSEEILNYVKNAGTYFNAGRAAYKANRLEQSKLYLEKAIELDPTDYSPTLDYAVTVCTMGEFDRAVDIINSIDKTNIDEENKKIIEFNKGWHYIRQGDFRKGIDLLHLGREINVWGSHANKYNRPQWDGQTVPGATILLVGEGGIGDEVINARFSKIIQERGMKCIMSTVHKNRSMLSSVKTLDKVIDNADINAEAWDYWAPCMDTPYILKIDADDISNDTYLYAKEEYINKWSNIIKSDKKLKVGIRWSGNPRYELELARTIPINKFEELNDLDIQMFSLQLSDKAENFKVPDGAIDLESQLKSWDDTMGAIMNMDLIITSCTSIAHIAAALGKPTWIVIPLLPYYTWADMKKDSYWYKSVQLYRQREWKEWNAPFVDVRDDLIKLLESK